MQSIQGESLFKNITMPFNLKGFTSTNKTKQLLNLRLGLTEWFLKPKIVVLSNN